MKCDTEICSPGIDGIVDSLPEGMQMALAFNRDYIYMPLLHSVEDL